MKKIYIITTFLFAFINLNAQTVTITDSCGPTLIDGDYTLSSDVNGKSSFINSTFIIQWIGSRWEHIAQDGSGVSMYNNLDTPYPPASSLSEWTPVNCNPTGTFSGNGTSTSDQQIVTITGSCGSVGAPLIDGDYTISSDINGKPSFINTNFIIQWTGSRWEHIAQDGSGVSMYNNFDTPYPPASSLSEWTPVHCNPTGTFSGSGTSTSLSTNEFELNSEIKLNPNPSSEFIQISGLTEQENYRIYNIIGAVIKNGIISNQEKIDIGISQKDYIFEI